MSSPNPTSFAQLGLSDAVLRAVYEVGYETPSPIQAAAIGPLLEGRDIIGQAQTGTGKTAAFALPLLSRLDLSITQPQVLVLTPTRELAIQVAEAFQTYARYLNGFHVLPVYGGQSFGLQLRPLRRGVHAVVGTPGRILDHLRRGTLPLGQLRALVLDEADEMLRMGFIDDVELILERAPEAKQVALFSATMPRSIQGVAQRHTRNAAEIRIKAATTTVATVSQRFWQVAGVHKLDALTRLLETEDFDAMLVFVRTKSATVELAERLEARGFSSAPLNGDMNQGTRELTVERLKSKRLDILVATDVAARGLDVDRISHVVNFDIPYDVEAYVHRIGRTARAGRKGAAILFVAPRERRMLRAIERATGQPIEPMKIPTRGDVADRRAERFKAGITAVLESQDLAHFERLVESYQAEHDVTPQRLAAALAYLAQGERPPIEAPALERVSAAPRSDGRAPGHGAANPGPRQGRPPEPQSAAPERRERKSARPDAIAPVAASPDRQVARTARDPAAPARAPAGASRSSAGGRPPPDGLTRYRLEVGASHGVEPKHIVGAIANEAGLDSAHIGAVVIEEEHSTVELPSGMPKPIFKHLKQVWVCGRRLKLSVADAAPDARPARSRASSERTGREADQPDKIRGGKQSRPDAFKPGSKPGFKGGKPRAGRADVAAGGFGRRDPEGRAVGPGAAVGNVSRPDLPGDGGARDVGSIDAGPSDAGSVDADHKGSGTRAGKPLGGKLKLKRPESKRPDGKRQGVKRDGSKFSGVKSTGVAKRSGPAKRLGAKRVGSKSAASGSGKGGKHAVPRDDRGGNKA